MYKKHLSGKIARVFEIVGYFLLIPAILLLVLSAIIMVTLLISVPLFSIGLTLFAGYVKHSRGNLSEGKILPLWIASFLFNFLPLAFLMNQYYSDANKILENLNIFTGVLSFWWIIACCLSLTAFYDEFTQQNLRSNRQKV